MATGIYYKENIYKKINEINLLSMWKSDEIFVSTRKS